MRGLLVAFEGLDRSGKSSQTKLLNNYITNSLKEKAKILVFPGEKYFNRSIDTYWKSNRLIFKE